MAAFYFAISILLVGLTSIKALPAKSISESCDVHGADRRECGWPGINEDTCIKRDCCWDSTDPHAKWCFRKKTITSGSCNVYGADRRECGWLGIDEATCLRKGCCWNATDPNAKWCFVKKPISEVILICEGDKTQITCRRGSWIHIIYANFGRTMAGQVCELSENASQSTQCYAREALKKVRSFCEGRQTCRLAATTAVYGDPCPRTSKYLDVEYSCNENICGPVAPSQRVDCGYKGISKRKCQDKGCCWDDSVADAKWCYYEEGEPTIGCYIYHGISGKCRKVCKPGESKAFMHVCKDKICCYRSLYGRR